MIRRRVDAALLVRDALTGLPVPGGVRCELDGTAVCPVRKPDGWLVLTDLPAGPHLLRLHGSGFQDASFLLMGGRYQERSVDLEPDETYRLPKDGAVLYLRFQHTPADRVFLGMSGPVTLKLSRNAEAGQGEVPLFVRGPAFRFPVPGWALAADGNAPERVFLKSVSLDGTGKLETPLSHPHRRGTALIPGRLRTPDERGEIRAAFPSPGTVSVFCGGEWQTVLVRSGEQRLDWNG